MNRAMAITVGLLLISSPAWAGPNPNASLAMHLVPTDDYLYCDDDQTPYICAAGMTCADIDNSVLVGDLGAEGYCYLVILAYNYGTLGGVEFCIDGWPTTRKPSFEYCPTATSQDFGSAWYASGKVQQGVAVGLGTGIDNPSGSLTPDGVYCFGFASFDMGALDSGGHLPFTLSFYPSTYTVNPGEGSKVSGEPPDYPVDMVDVSHEHTCTIGAAHTAESIPYTDCTFAQPTDRRTWTGVKALYR